MDDFTIQKVAGAVTSPVTGISETKVRTEIKREENEEKAAQESKANVNVEEIVEKIQKRISSYNTSLEFKMDKEGKPPIVVVTDKETGQVIRQIPSEEVIQLRNRMEDLMGLIYNGRI